MKVTKMAWILSQQWSNADNNSKFIKNVDFINIFVFHSIRQVRIDLFMFTSAIPFMGCDRPKPTQPTKKSDVYNGLKVYE